MQSLGTLFHNMKLTAVRLENDLVPAHDRTPDQHRIALTNLIMTLSEDHLERIVQGIMPELRKDIVTTLPEPASLAVLNSLTPDQLLRVGSVSREWQFIASSNSVWQEKCHEIGIQQLPPDIAVSDERQASRCFTVVQDILLSIITDKSTRR